MQREQRESALEPGDDATECLIEVARRAVLATEEDGGHLGVRLGLEREALGEQLVFQRGEVLDDAVVDDRQPAVVTQVRVRIAVGRSAVGRPPRVPDARGSVGDGVRAEVIGQR